MSKKDKQHLQQPLTPQLMNQPDKVPSDGDVAREVVAFNNAEIDRLKAELDAERSRHATEYNALSAKAADLRADLLAVHIVADGGAMQEAITKDGRETVAAVAKVLEQRKALHSDLMALEQTAAGSPVRTIPQTDLGKSALAAMDEVLAALHKSRDAHLEGDALPANGWASATARQLVEAVGPQPGLRASDVRALLLGDLLAQLLPHTGETGQNETASDVLKRLLVEVVTLTDLTVPRLEGQVHELEAARNAISERMVKIQSAMVARRAPDAESAMHMALVVQALGPASPFFPGSTTHGLAAKVVDEWKSLRAFFSEAPLVAVAVRDDGAKGPVRERFSLLVLSWDGKSVKTQVVEGTRPWGDISPYLDSAVRKHLIPDAYR